MTDSSLAIETWPTRVSDESLWNDETWVFPADTDGQRPTTIRWKVKFADEALITSPRWQYLLESGKRFLWSLKVRHMSGPPPKSLSLGHYGTTIKELLRWMADTNTWSFSEIDSLAVKDFQLWLSENRLNSSKKMPTYGTAAAYVNILNKLYAQRDVLSADPRAVMPERPYGSYTLAKAVADVGEFAPAKRRPLTPDDVIVSILNVALEWLDAPARDLERLLKYINIEYKAEDEIKMPMSMIEFALRQFEFDDGGLLAEPWRPRFSEKYYFENGIVNRYGKETSAACPLRAAGELINDFVAACVLILQGLTGIRNNEVCSLLSEPRDPKSGWPACLSVALSNTGLHEVFYIHGRVAKGRDGSQPVQWIAGLRPIGTDYVPAPIRAILAMDRILAPWRREASSNKLCVAVVDPEDVSERNAKELLSDRFGKCQKAFVDKYVRVPDEYRDWNLTPGQWRRAFAMFMVRTDGRLLSAVSDHFKHMSLAITEQGYLDADPDLLGLMYDVEAMEHARLLSDVHNGDVVASGPMATLLNDRKAEIDSRLALLTEAEDKVEAFRQIMEQERLRVFSSSWGKCFFRPETARCHYDATGAFQIREHAPDYVFRRPEVCGKCANLLVTEDQKQFWRDRHGKHVEAYENSIEVGDERLTDIISGRLSTSAGVLRKLGIDLEPLSEGA